MVLDRAQPVERVDRGDRLLLAPVETTQAPGLGGLLGRLGRVPKAERLIAQRGRPTQPTRRHLVGARAADHRLALVADLRLVGRRHNPAIVSRSRAATRAGCVRYRKRGPAVGKAMSDTTRRFLAFLLPSAAVATLVCGIVVVALQQELRQAADDPQHQLAEDAIVALDAGAPASSIVGSDRVDIAVSLEPFRAVYDASGGILATDGQLDGAAPGPPRGVLDTARTTGIDRVTWQPRSGVRVALVVLRWSGGTVLAGRSLRRGRLDEG